MHCLMGLEPEKFLKCRIGILEGPDRLSQADYKWRFVVKGAPVDYYLNQLQTA